MKVAANTFRVVTFHHRKPVSAGEHRSAAVASRPGLTTTGDGVRLTPRELEVLALLCEGLPNKLIARRLDIATGTVKIHVGRILAELGVSSRLQAVVAAQRLGLLADRSAMDDEETRAPRIAPTWGLSRTSTALFTS